MSVTVTPISRADFLALAHDASDELMRRIATPEAFIVKRFYDPDAVLALRDEAFRWGLSSEPSWHPLHDGCPDYHRLHDNYTGAWFKQKLHAFYRHGWYAENRRLFSFFADVFALKNHLAGHPPTRFLYDQPSAGIVGRVNVHHYPVGGGYQAEHIDPTGPHAQIQTLIQASRFGVDFHSGGVYARASESAEERCYLDPHCEVGDMIVMSPGIPHGVAPIDEEAEYAWREWTGRWMILPLFLQSDYARTADAKPRQVGG